MKHITIFNLILCYLFLIQCNGSPPELEESPLNHTITLKKSLTGVYVTVAYSDPSSNQITRLKKLSKKGDCIRVSPEFLDRVIFSATSDEKEKILCSNSGAAHSPSCGTGSHYEIKNLGQEYDSGWAIDPSSSPNTSARCEEFSLKEISTNNETIL